MAPLARLPVFYKLDGKRVVVAGSSDAVAWKVELLAATGAQVFVFAVEASDALLAVATDCSDRVTLIVRDWIESDFENAALAIGGCDTDDEAARFSAAAKKSGVPVNVIDKPKFCDFAFGAIVNRSPLVVGISTDGAAPVFAQAIRARIEAMLPAGFARWMELARELRPRVAATFGSAAGRRTFWSHFADRAMALAHSSPNVAELDPLFAELRPASPGGSVTLVGAGPGNPDLLTLAAVRALQSADVILYDDLVSTEVLDFARREARKMLVGKTGYAPSCRQDEVSALMVSLAKAGKRVVRLKGGDPMLFGRASEELKTCADNGIAVDVVPGITAAQGAAAALKVSLTQRKAARRVQYLTGHGADGKLPQDLDWSSLSDPAVTTIVYMPARTLAELSSRAIATGLDPATPAVAISRATRPDQVFVSSTISALPTRLTAAPLPGPLLVMIGRAMAFAVSETGSDAPTAYVSSDTAPNRSIASSILACTRLSEDNSRSISSSLNPRTA